MADIIAYSPLILLFGFFAICGILAHLPRSESSKDYDTLQRLADDWRKQGHPEPFKAALLEIHILAALEKARGWISQRYMVREVDPRDLAKAWLKDELPIFASIHGSKAGTQLRKMVQTADPESLLQGRALAVYRRRIDEAVERVMKRYADTPMPEHYRAVYDALREK